VDLETGSGGKRGGERCVVGHLLFPFFEVTGSYLLKGAPTLDATRSHRSADFTVACAAT
jgi:hypothetical protein